MPHTTRDAELFRKALRSRFPLGNQASQSAGKIATARLHELGLQLIFLMLFASEGLDGRRSPNRRMQTPNRRLSISTVAWVNRSLEASVSVSLGLSRSLPARGGLTRPAQRRPCFFGCSPAKAQLPPGSGAAAHRAGPVVAIDTLHGPRPPRRGPTRAREILLEGGSTLGDGPQPRCIRQ